MKKIIILTVILFLGVKAFSQIEFNVQNITLDQVKSDTSYMIEGFGEGPYVMFDCSIVNNTDSIIELNRSSVFITFYFDDKKMTKFSMDIESQMLSVKLDQGDTMTFTGIYSMDFEFTKYKKVSADYTQEMLLILPTVKVHVVSDEIELISDRVYKVSILSQP